MPQNVKEVRLSKTRLRSTLATLSDADRERPIRHNTNGEYLSSGPQLAKQKASSRALFLDILGATATKREAKSYLSRFQPGRDLRASPEQSQKDKGKAGFTIPGDAVNLGDLYLPVRSIDDSPVFSLATKKEPLIDRSKEPTHAALVVLRSPESVDEKTLHGVAQTLSQLSHLGLHSVVVLEPSYPGRIQDATSRDPSWRRDILGQVDRITKAISSITGQQARRLDGILQFSLAKGVVTQSVKVKGNMQILNRDLLLSPLQRGTIPVVAPICSTTDQKLIPASANDIVLAITRELVGINFTQNAQSTPSLDDPGDPAATSTLKKPVTLDRIIVLDSQGGIPPSEPSNRAHVFINLEQEYKEISRDLEKLEQKHRDTGLNTNVETGENLQPERQTTGQDPSNQSLSSCSDRPPAINNHRSNLQLARDTLALLPPTSSALITSPQAVARSDTKSSSSPSPGVGTRPQRNILIHNLLTDKPLFSSSLPTSRLSLPQSQSQLQPTPSNPPTSTTSSTSPITHSQPLPTTFLKHGMPLTILPDPRLHPWTPPPPGSPPPLSLSDPRLSLPSLIHLIEDSFSRPLSTSSYFSRIGPNLAGIVIAGAYEGCAILTWESPPGAPRGDSTRLVPYLDKFAVLKRSQGAGGVADIVFSALVRDVWPGGVVWRSREGNPVNKWYFERGVGSWKLGAEERGGGKSWRMFWTTEGVDGGLWADYEGVCRSIGTCWADGKTVLD
ncbi:Amino-acid acetyltransferase, mitochondrial [Thelotrema lepadinum]|nr:Amino-acid acetyltransferase, mitochondrial [Thelotrema lepadinum]